MGLPEDFVRADTALALVVAFVLASWMLNDILKGLGFAVLFVMVFLVLKHLLIG